MRIISALMLFFSLLVLQASGQGPDRPPGPAGMPKFYFEALSFSGGENGKERTDVLIEIPYEALQFVREGENFISRSEITVTFHDSDETLVDEKFWRETIRVTEYEKTVTSEICYVNQRTFYVAPGSYMVSVTVKDAETEMPVLQKKKINVRQYSASRFAISDIMLASHVAADTGGLVVTPNISGSVGGKTDSFYIYFDIYSKINADSAMISLVIRNMKNAVVRSDTFGQRLNMSPQGVFRALKTDALIAGDYSLEISCFPLPDPTGTLAKNDAARASRRIGVRWRGMPQSVSDLDQAIEQLLYIANRDLIDEIRRASPEMKKDLFQRFWKTKDPTPQTERNEIMEEYYLRVTYANTHFSYYLEGWKTDMGMIYILFGAPSNIERHPFEMNTKPYEIWSYYEQNREFIFIDVSGFGEYRLQNTDWDLTGIRTR